MLRRTILKSLTAVFVPNLGLGEKSPQDLVLRSYADSAYDQYSSSIIYQQAVLAKPSTLITASEYNDIIAAARGPFDGNYEDAIVAAKQIAKIRPTKEEIAAALRDNYPSVYYSDDEFNSIVDEVFADSQLGETALLAKFDALKAQDAAQTAKAQELCQKIGIDYSDNAPYQDFERTKKSFTKREEHRENENCRGI